MAMASESSNAANVRIGTDAHAEVVVVRFGQIVRTAREARGLSQERLAARAELNRSYIGEVERADAMPSLATADKLARGLGLPLWRLLQRCEDAPENGAG